MKGEITDPFILVVFSFDGFLLLLLFFYFLFFLFFWADRITISHCVVKQRIAPQEPWLFLWIILSSLFPSHILFIFVIFLKGKYLANGNAVLTEWLDLKIAKFGCLLSTILFNKWWLIMVIYLPTWRQKVHFKPKHMHCQNYKHTLPLKR